MKRALARVAILALAAVPQPLLAQLTDPGDDWRTVRTEHFRVHFPRSASEWTLPMVARLESVQAAVARLVGYAPTEPVDLVVSDPLAAANGIAFSFLDDPFLVFFPTPPSPRQVIGEHRGWSELLAVHEYAHLAHLTRPSRNPLENALWRLSPLSMGPVARRAPRWVKEGYATYVEGRLTGAGRPHGAWRPAHLRQWAIEGQLPSYEELSETGGYRTGSMAYLAGSDYLEWLVEQRGEESLQQVWRRLSARERRSFAEAFAGVYGGTPAQLYGRYAADLTADAVRAREALEDAGLQTGDTIQRLSQETGDPTVSPDGAHLALVVRDGDGPGRLVVWKTAEEPEDSAAIRRRAEALERDPEDVPAIQWRPRPKEPVATLHPATGSAHHDPRFLRDGRRILVVRSEPRGVARMVPDLFLWSYDTGDLRRVTTDAGIQHADPAPDGETAVAVQCRGGVCSLVRVDLADGAVTELLRGSPDRVYHRPRVSPLGATAAVAVQESGRWRVALVDLAAPRLRYIDPEDGADRYDPAFASDGRTLVVVSHATGIPNLERIDLATGGAETITRVTGAAMAPEPAPDGTVYLLTLHSRGLDLNRLPADAPALTPVAIGAPAQVMPAPAATPAAPFAEAELPTVRPYGVGPRLWRWAVAGSSAPDGESTNLVIASTDPIGRLTVLLQGGLASGDAWGGGSAAVGWRGWGPTFRLEGFYAEQDPELPALGPGFAPPASLRYAGTVGSVELTRVRRSNIQRGRIGGSGGGFHLAGEPSRDRYLGFGEYAASLRQSVGRLQLSQSLDLHGSAGATGGAGWTRGIASAALGASRGEVGIRLEAAHGRVSADADSFESFTLGGSDPVHFDRSIVSQRVAIPALPAGFLTGDRFTSVRASASPEILGLRPYFQAVTVEEELTGWYRLVGGEFSIATENLPTLRLGGVEILAGVAYPLDDPYRHDLRFYGSLRLRP